MDLNDERRCEVGDERENNPLKSISYKKEKVWHGTTIHSDFFICFKLFYITKLPSISLHIFL